MLDFSQEEVEDIKLHMAFIAGYQNMMDALEEEKLINNAHNRRVEHQEMMQALLHRSERREDS